MKKASKALPLLGHLLPLIKDPLSFLHQCMVKSGGRFYVKLGFRTIYFFTDPEDVKRIYLLPQHQLSKSGVRQQFGKSILTSDGAVWDRLFKYARPFFVKRNLETLFPVIHQEIDGHISTLKSKKNFDLHKELFTLINALVIKLFYTGENESEVKIPELNESISIITKNITLQTVLPFKIPSWFPYPGKSKYLRVQKDFDEFVSGLINRKATLEEKTLLQHMLKDPDISEEEIKMQALTFYMAGFETTVNALFWTVKLILENESVTEKLKLELKTVAVKEIGTFEELKKLTYTTACLKEGLRLFPPAWFRTREVKEDFFFDEKLLLKRKAHVVVSPYLTQRNELYYEDANRFLPERFLNHDHDPASYFPFSSGRNICTGRDLAWVEMVLYLAYFFKELDVSEQKEAISYKAAVTIRPRKDLTVILKSTDLRR